MWMESGLLDGEENKQHAWMSKGGVGVGPGDNIIQKKESLKQIVNTIPREM